MVAVLIVMLGLCHHITRADPDVVPAPQLVLLAAQRSWLHALALPKHALCWRVSCKQPHHLGIYNRHCASTHSDKHVFARLAALPPKPTPGEPLRGLCLPACCACATAQHCNPSPTHCAPGKPSPKAHTHTKSERKEEDFLSHLK